jgi:uncharacterized protein
MKLEELPLLDIFNSLRQRHGLPLGVEEYLVVVRSLEAGFGISNKQELEQLCCMLWAKSEEDNRLIRRLFEQMWKQIESHPVNFDSPTQENSQNSIDQNPSITDTSNSISHSFTQKNSQSSSIETSISEAPSIDEPLLDLETTPTGATRFCEVGQKMCF